MLIKVVQDFPGIFRTDTTERKELVKTILEMPTNQVVCVTFNNMKDARLAQSFIQSGDKGKNPIRVAGKKISTRTLPENGDKNGRWNLYIKRVQ